MRHWIYAQPNCWLTQSESNNFRPRIFVKALPVNYPDKWTNWTEEQYQEYISNNGEPNVFDLLKYAHNFDYSKVPGGIMGSPDEQEEPEQIEVEPK